MTSARQVDVVARLEALEAKAAEVDDLRAQVGQLREENRVLRTVGATVKTVRSRKNAANVGSFNRSPSAGVAVR